MGKGRLEGLERILVWLRVKGLRGREVWIGLLGKGRERVGLKGLLEWRIRNYE